MIAAPDDSDDPVPQPANLAAQEIRLVSALVVILGLGLFMALPFVLSIGSVVFLPLFSALILSIVLSPLAARIAGIGVPNVIASLLAVLVFIAICALVVMLIVTPALDTFAHLPAMISRIRVEMIGLRGSFSWLFDLDHQLARLVGRSTGHEVVLAEPTVIEQVAFATPSLVLEFVLTLLLTFFMIELRMRMRRYLLLDRTSFDSSLKAARVIRQVQDRVAGYILTVGLINLGVGAIVTGAAWLFGFEAPVMWGGIAFVLNFLPYVGPLIMIAVLALFGLGTQDTLVGGIAPALAYLALHTIELNLITPAVLGARFTINPVLILVSMSYFTWIWGVVGALLSVPILLTLAALVEHLGKPNLVGFLFGEPLFPDSSEFAGGGVQPG